MHSIARSLLNRTGSAMRSRMGNILNNTIKSGMTLRMQIVKESSVNVGLFLTSNPKNKDI